MTDESSSSRERWQRMEALFHGALELPPEARDAYLRAELVGDPELRFELEEMLAAHEDELGLAIERRLIPSDEPGAPGGPAPGGLAPGWRIGPYAILRRLGRGGMGDVYLAERADGEFEKRVALKLMRAGFESRSLAARFRQERQVLARLEHPGIARLLDGGLTPEGLPFLVMELVEGVPITRYCDEEALDIEARVRLFQSVCRALQYAHQNLVVHRDLKPSNILVTPLGEPKLLDFGIAKLLTVETFESRVTFTGGGVHPLTPEYASPEQVRGTPVSTASDVYSLGLLLYELLTGVRAQPLGDGSPATLVESVCHRDPPRPSAVVVTGGSLRAEQRGCSSAERLARLLSGDLDTIVATATRKDPALRYPSAEALAEDLDRYLLGLPVRARAGTLRYRTQKFLRRHRLAVAAAAIAVLAVVSGLGLALAGLARAQRAEARAREEVEIARRSHDLMVNLFRLNPEDGARGETISAREVLDRGAARVAESKESQSVVRARHLNFIGRSYLGLGLVEPAERLLNQQVSSLRDETPPRPLDLSRALTSLSLLYSAKGDYARSRDLAREAVAILEEQAEADPAWLSDSLHQLASVLASLGELDEARETAERALALRHRVLGPDHPRTAESRQLLERIVRGPGGAAAATSSRPAR